MNAVRCLQLIGREWFEKSAQAVRVKKIFEIMDEEVAAECAASVEDKKALTNSL